LRRAEGNQSDNSIYHDLYDNGGEGPSRPRGGRPEGTGKRQDHLGFSPEQEGAEDPAHAEWLAHQERKDSWFRRYEALRAEGQEFLDEEGYDMGPVERSFIGLQESSRQRKGKGKATNPQESLLPTTERQTRPPTKDKTRQRAKQNHRSKRKSIGKGKSRGNPSFSSDSSSPPSSESESSSEPSDSSSSTSDDDDTSSSSEESSTHRSSRRGSHRRSHRRRNHGKRRWIKKGRPDFAKLNDGRTIGPKPSHWALSVRAYLQGNRDYGNDEGLRTQFVYDMTEGLAKDLLYPKHYRHEYRKASKMIKEIVALLSDPAQESKDKDAFRKLRMTDNQRMHEFYARYLTMAGNAKFSTRQYRDDFWAKLSPRIRHGLANKIRDIASFEELYAQAVSLENEWVLLGTYSYTRSATRVPQYTNSSSAPLRQDTGNLPPVRGLPPVMYQPPPLRSTPASNPPRPPMTPRHHTPATTQNPANRQSQTPAPKVNLETAKCYRCQEIGHFANDCPHGRGSVINAVEHNGRMIVQEGTWRDEDTNQDILLFSEVREDDAATGRSFQTDSTPGVESQTNYESGNGEA
jgi:hypothetical protein